MANTKTTTEGVDQLVARMRRAVDRAQEVLKMVEARPLVEKTIWGSPAGKKRIAKRLAAMLPPHKTYVEPFAGSAAVLFAKEPSPVEAINDADQEIAKAFKIVKRLRPAAIKRLRAMKWIGDEATFQRLRKEDPQCDVDWLHRFLYLSHFAYGKIRGKSFSPSAAGVESRAVDRIEEFLPRLKQVKVFVGDYEPIVRRFDGPNAVHFLDPPYAGYNVEVGESKFDEQRFCDLLKSLKGKFLITYGVRGELPKLLKQAGYNIKQIRTPRTIRTMRGVGGSTILTQLLVSNYDIKKKSLTQLEDDGWEVSDWSPENAPSCALANTEAEKSLFSKSIPLIKGADPKDERFVLGVVLEPETVDAQGDVYSADEVRQAAHTFMEEFGGIGLMHRMKVNGQVKILESYLAPSPFKIGDVEVKKGTWLLAVRVLSDELWAQVRDGQLGGFSIGGSARRVPEDSESRPAPAAADDSGAQGLSAAEDGGPA